MKQYPQQRLRIQFETIYPAVAGLILMEVALQPLHSGISVELEIGLDALIPGEGSPKRSVQSRLGETSPLGERLGQI